MRAQRVGHHGRGRIGPHAAGVRAFVAVENALVILRGRQRQRMLAVAQREERRLLALHELLDNHFRASLAEAAAEHHVDGIQRLFKIHRHHDALARRKAISLHHNRRTLRADIGLGCVGIGEMLIGGGRDVVRPAQGLGETLRAFELAGGFARSECLDPGGGQVIDDPRRDRRIRPDDDEIDCVRAAERDHLCMVGDIQRDAFSLARDAGIARRAPQFREQRRRRDLPGQRMFAPAGTKQKDVHERLPVDSASRPDPLAMLDRARNIQDPSLRGAEFLVFEERRDEAIQSLFLRVRLDCCARRQIGQPI